MKLLYDHLSNILRSLVFSPAALVDALNRRKNGIDPELALFSITLDHYCLLAFQGHTLGIQVRRYSIRGIGTEKCVDAICEGGMEFLKAGTLIIGVLGHTLAGRLRTTLELPFLWPLAIQDPSH